MRWVVWGGMQRDIRFPLKVSKTSKHQHLQRKTHNLWDLLCSINIMVSRDIGLNCWRNMTSSEGILTSIISIQHFQKSPILSNLLFWLETRSNDFWCCSMFRLFRLQLPFPLQRKIKFQNFFFFKDWCKGFNRKPSIANPVQRRDKNVFLSCLILYWTDSHSIFKILLLDFYGVTGWITLLKSNLPNHLTNLKAVLYQ